MKETRYFTALEYDFLILSFYTSQLANEYREKKKLTDKLKEDLQTKINEYTKFAEQGLWVCVCVHY